MAGSRTLMMFLLAVLITAETSLGMVYLGYCKGATINETTLEPYRDQTYFRADYTFSTRNPDVILTVQYHDDVAKLIFLGLRGGYLQMIVFCLDFSSITVQPPGGVLNDGDTHTVKYSNAISSSLFIVDDVSMTTSVKFSACKTHRSDGGPGSYEKYKDVMQAIMSRRTDTSGCLSKVDSLSGIRDYNMEKENFQAG